METGQLGSKGGKILQFATPNFPPSWQFVRLCNLLVTLPGEKAKESAKDTDFLGKKMAITDQSDFGIDHLVMSMCRVFSCVVGGGCLL